MINTLIVEDSIISRELFERQLAASPDYCVIASIENAANAEIGNRYRQFHSTDRCYWYDFYPAFGINASGTYEVKEDNIVITYTIFGMSNTKV